MTHDPPDVTRGWLLAVDGAVELAALVVVLAAAVVAEVVLEVVACRVWARAMVTTRVVVAEAVVVPAAAEAVLVRCASPSQPTISAVAPAAATPTP